MHVPQDKNSPSKLLLTFAFHFMKGEVFVIKHHTQKALNKSQLFQAGLFRALKNRALRNLQIVLNKKGYGVTIEGRFLCFKIDACVP
jgi:hypothetical protein